MQLDLRVNDDRSRHERGHDCEPKLDARGKVSKFAGNEFQYIRQVLEARLGPPRTVLVNLGCVLWRLRSQQNGEPNAIAMNSGTSTLHACLVAAGVKAGDEVISPALTVIMDTHNHFARKAQSLYMPTSEKTPGR